MSTTILSAENSNWSIYLFWFFQMKNIMVVMLLLSLLWKKLINYEKHMGVVIQTHSYLHIISVYVHKLNCSVTLSVIRFWNELFNSQFYVLIINQLYKYWSFIILWYLLITQSPHKYEWIKSLRFKKLVCDNKSATRIFSGFWFNIVN